MATKFRKADQWQQFILLFEQSELSVTEFCRQHQLAVSSFYQWRKRLKDKVDLVAEQLDDWQPISTAQITVDADTQANINAHWDIELSLPNGVTLRMRQ